MQSESHITSKILLTLSSLNFINYIINSYSLRKGTEKDEKRKMENHNYGNKEK